MNSRGWSNPNTIQSRARAFVWPIVGVFVFSSVLLAQLPEHVDQEFRQASAAMRQGNIEAAAEGFSAVVKQAPMFAEAHMNLGLAREEQGKHEEAIQSF